ncbi:MAG TPA: tRNA-dihydrouridine synthase [Anaerolineaceae bacterium]|nr:tRNA-dihydrouridine synthase [Anaerolineaceae bacterium]
MFDQAQKPAFTVGTIPVFGDLILSPMDGFSDLPFRSLARRLGSAMSYTEFVNAIDVAQGSPRLAPRLAYDPAERPVVFQIFDDDPDRLVAAAMKLRAFEPDVIDVNMGCSAKTVSGRGAGAGLLRTPQKIARIFSQLSKSLDIPVTGKIRLGWDEESLNYLEVARIIEDNGGQLVAVHGRTKKQGYSGEVNWNAIAEIKQAVRIPVIGNGNVRTVEDIARIRRHTGCDGVMIARAAIGNPWIFSRLDRETVAIEQVRKTMLAHLESMLSFYGLDEGLVLFRKHASRYISPYPLDRDLRARLLTSQTTEEFLALLDETVLSAEALPGTV